MRTNPDYGSHEISMLQYGRGIAALFVCLFHSYGLIDQYFGGMSWGHIFQAGHSGVEFFFILSGFIILRAHYCDIGNPDQVKTFLVKRAVRILPMFWLVTLSLGSLFLLVPIFGTDRELTRDKLMIDLLLIPRDAKLTLPPAWTLQHEAIFYLIFTLVIINRAFGIIAIGLWQTICIFVVMLSLHDPNYLLPINKLIGFHNIGFGVGIAIAMFFASSLFAPTRSILLIGGALAAIALCGLFAGEWLVGPDLFGGVAKLSSLYFIIYALIILALLTIEQRPRPVLDATLGVLGSASYVLYLIHEPVASFVNKVLLLSALRPLITSTTAYMLIVLTCVTTAIAAHFVVERPIMNWLRRSLIAQRQLRPALAK